MRSVTGATNSRDEDGQFSSSHRSEIQYISIPRLQNNESPLSDSNNLNETHPLLMHRRSILDQPIGSFKGVNSISRFATSLRRANSFMNIEVDNNKERSFFKDSLDETFDPETMAPNLNGRRLSVVLNQVSGIQREPIINNIESGSIFSRVGHESEDLLTLESIENSDVAYRPTRSMAEMVMGVPTDRDSIIVKTVYTKDGSAVTVLAGQSTKPQTIFNSINVLIGIGLFALPLGLSHAGWVLGLSMLTLFAFGTFYTAKLLSKCLDMDPTLMSYADLGYAAFGPKGRILISSLFTIDLLSCGVSLVILFGDSLNALFPKYSVNFFKILCFFIVTPPIFIPLNILSNISLLGILSTIGTVGIIVISGFYRSEGPGSFYEVMPTNMWPRNFQGFCLSIGLLSACWGGHAIFPNLKTDMRHPEKFESCLKATYKITAITDIGTAVVGFLLFGNYVKDEITKNILHADGYPRWIYVLISTLMTIIPIAKTPLNARPIVSVLDFVFNIKDSDIGSVEKPLLRQFCWLLNRLFVNALFVALAIAIPSFDKIIAFMGAGLCFAICFILPSLFYLRIVGRFNATSQDRFICYVFILAGSIMSVMGIGAAILA